MAVSKQYKEMKFTQLSHPPFISAHLLQTFSTVQFWLEGIFFTAFGIVGLVGALVTIAVLATKDLRDSH